jgi:hypothetical protein
MAKPKDISKAAAWAKEREPLHEKPAASLTNAGAVANWSAKASARSGPAYAPGLGKSSS